MKGWNPLLFIVGLVYFTSDYTKQPLVEKPFMGLAYIAVYVLASVLFAVSNRHARWHRALILVWGMAVGMDLILVLPFSMINGTAFKDIMTRLVMGLPAGFFITLLFVGLVFTLGWNSFGRAWLSQAKSCTNCRGQMESQWNYCPHCGSRVIVEL